MPAGGAGDLGLIAFGLGCASRGWRVVYLGTDSPIETVEEVARQLDPSLVVLTAVSSERVLPVLPQLQALGRPASARARWRRRRERRAEGSDALALSGDPIAEAARVTTLVQGGERAAVRTAVLGATGFVGRALVPALAQRGEVVAISRRATAPLPGVRCVAADLTNRESTRGRSRASTSPITSSTRSARATSPSSIGALPTTSWPRPSERRRPDRLSRRARR